MFSPPLLLSNRCHIYPFLGLKGFLSTAPPHSLCISLQAVLVKNILFVCQSLHMESFIESYKLPCFDWSVKQRKCSTDLYYKSYLSNGSLYSVTSRSCTAFCCFASSQVLGTFPICKKLGLVKRKCKQDRLETPARKCFRKCQSRERNRRPFQCQLFGPKSNKETWVGLSEVEKERKRLVQRIFDACSAAEQKEKVEKVVAAAGFLDASQRLKLWIHIEQLSIEKLFEASVYNFERAAELRDEASLLRLRDAHIILQESIDEALRQGELGFAKIFYEALQLVGEPPNWKKRIPSQGGEARRNPTTPGSGFDTSLVNEVSLSSSMESNDNTRVLSPTHNEDNRKEFLDLESSDQTFVEPASCNLWENQEMFGDALIDTEGVQLMNESRDQTNNNSVNLKVSPNNTLFGLDTTPKDNVIGYSKSSPSVPPLDNISETLANSDKDSNSKTGMLGDKMTSWTFSYSEIFSHILKVQLQGKWNMDRSSLSEHYLCFEYQIQIVNTGSEFIQLLSSNGFVETSDGRKHSLAEEMIADRKPVVQDGETFEYSSFCIFQHPIVPSYSSVVGFLKMVFVFVRGDCGQQLFHLETSPVHLRLV